MTTYLSRTAWTSTPASGATLTGAKLRGCAVHWPGTTQAAIGDPGQDEIASRLRSYRNFHVNSNGWRDIGYNLAIDQAGRVWMLRSTQWRGNLIGAHCASASNPDANEEYVGVLLLLGLSEQPRSAMVAAFRDWYHDRFLPGWPGRTDVRGHRQVPGAQTNCPGDRAINLINTGEFTRKPADIPEDDMTPEQARSLADIEALVRNLNQWAYRMENDKTGLSLEDRVWNKPLPDAVTGRNQSAHSLLRSARRDAYTAAAQAPALAALQALVAQNAVTVEQVLAAVDGVDEPTVQALREALGSLND